MPETKDNVKEAFTRKEVQKTLIWFGGAMTFIGLIIGINIGYGLK